jgi:hypothetical protein
MNGTVESCPGNATAAAEASSRLRCGRDEYGNDQYICVPNDSKTALMEFCHDGIMGLIQEGTLLLGFEVSQKRQLIKTARRQYTFSYILTK